MHETLRDVNAEELDEGEEEYPPGPAQLTAADPEVMPSEMEAMDDLQRTLKVGLLDSSKEPLEKAHCGSVGRQAAEVCACPAVK